MSQATDNQSTSRIRIVGKGIEATVTLRDGAASRDLLRQLPLTVTLEDYAHTEKIARLPRKLSTSGAPAGFDPSVGDLTYYAPWGNLAIFYKDFGYANGLVPLGHVDTGLASLARLEGNARVTIEKASP